jgi:PAS domain-containing protein
LRFYFPLEQYLSGENGRGEDRKRLTPMDGTDTITVENPTWDVADVQSGQKGGRFLGEFSDPSRLRDPATMDELTAAIHDLGPAPNGEAAMNRLERFIANVIANHPAMISIKDLQLRYRMANADLVQLFGMPLEQVLGRTASELLPGVGPAIDAQGARAIATLETIHGDYELEVEGEPRTFHLVSFAMTDDANRPVAQAQPETSVAELCCIASDVTDSRREQHANRLRAEATDLIWSALSEDRMVLTSQPVVEITTQHSVSEELLVRLALSGDGGLLQPSAFLPVAERFNLIQEIDSWMVSRAVTIAGDRAVQVNLSAVTLSDETARKRILATLASHPSAAARIVFEITETAARASLRRRPAVRRGADRTRLRLGPRRLRHRLWLVHLPAAPAAALPQDRPLVRHQPAQLPR